jgi:hypothetical protein
MLEYTQLLVPSLLLHTRPPFELIFIDIGSLDGTAAYLKGVAAGMATSHEEVGMVGPMSNNAAPPQLVETVPYRIGPRTVRPPRMSWTPVTRPALSRRVVV